MQPYQPLNIETSLPEKIYRRFRDLIYERVGISLGANKQALLSARLRKRMRALGMEAFADYYEYVQQDETEGELVQLIDAVSTNVTQFFRESRHFDVLAQALERWRDKGRKRFRLWCAAASSGEEPYTIAITARETLGPDADVKILATDISTRVLDIARAARYGQSKLGGVPKAILGKYFRRCEDRTTYEVDAGLRQMITFGRLNLANPPFPMTGPLDAILCRNVMIYFDRAVRQQLVLEMERLLAPDGLVFVGHSETLAGIDTRLVAVSPSVYTFR